MPGSSRKDEGIVFAGVPACTGACDEAAHGMAIEDMLLVRIALFELLMQFIGIKDDLIPSVLFCKESGMLVIRQGFAMPGMILACKHIAKPGQILGNMVKAFDVLAHSVDELDNALYLAFGTVRKPCMCGNAALSGMGGKVGRDTVGHISSFHLCKVNIFMLSREPVDNRNYDERQQKQRRQYQADKPYCAFVLHNHSPFIQSFQLSRSRHIRREAVQKEQPVLC